MEGAVKNEESRESRQIISKWMKILFWILIWNVIIGIVFNYLVVFPYYNLVGTMLDVGFIVLYGLILLKLNCFEENYKLAGICNFLVAAMKIILFFFAKEDVVAEVLELVNIAPALVATYAEMKAHSNVLYDVNRKMSENWCKLWDWNKLGYFGLVLSGILSFIIPVVGTLLLLIVSIAMLVFCILKFFYLYQSFHILKNQ